MCELVLIQGETFFLALRPESSVGSPENSDAAGETAGMRVPLDAG